MITIDHHKPGKIEYWILDGIRYSRDREKNMMLEGWTWMPGLHCRGGWRTKSEKTAKRAALFLHIQIRECIQIKPSRKKASCYTGIISGQGVYVGILGKRFELTQDQLDTALSGQVIEL